MMKIGLKFGAFLLSIEIWIVGLGVAASILVTWVLPWVVILAAGLWIIRWGINGKPSKRTSADFGVGILVLMVPVTLWVTSLPQTTTLQVYRLLTGIFLYYAIVNWMEGRKRLKLALWGVIGLSIALSLGALFGVEWVADKIRYIPAGIYPHFSSMLADTANPNVLAGSLVILFPFAPCVLLFAWKEISRGERFFAILASIIGGGILVLSQSRSALIALIAIFTLIFIFRCKWGWLTLLALLVVGTIVFGMIGEAARQGILISIQGSLEWDQRFGIWSRAIYMIRDFPFTGIGMGSFREVANLFYPFLQHNASDIPHAHNLFLQIAVDLGIPGLIAWLSILGVVVIASWRVYRRGVIKGDRWIMSIGVGLLCSQAALITHGMTDAVTWGMVRPAPIVWALWGLAVATWNVIDERVKVSQINRERMKLGS